jgi:hypothetical protein
MSFIRNDFGAPGLSAIGPYSYRRIAHQFGSGRRVATIAGSILTAKRAVLPRSWAAQAVFSPPRRSIGKPSAERTTDRPDFRPRGSCETHIPRRRHIGPVSNPTDRDRQAGSPHLLIVHPSPRCEEGSPGILFRSRLPAPNPSLPTRASPRHSGFRSACPRPGIIAQLVASPQLWVNALLFVKACVSSP